MNRQEQFKNLGIILFLQCGILFAAQNFDFNIYLIVFTTVEGISLLLEFS